MNQYPSLTVIIFVLPVVGWAASAVAHTVPAPPITLPAIPPDVEAALVYPNSSQRFFEEGIDQLEDEIQQLESEPSEPALTVQPEITEQFDDNPL